MDGQTDRQTDRKTQTTPVPSVISYNWDTFYLSTKHSPNRVTRTCIEKMRSLTRLTHSK